MAVALGFMFLVSFARWMAGLRRTLAVRSRPSLLRERPTEEIAPDDLARWVETVSEDEAGREGLDRDPPDG